MIILPVARDPFCCLHQSTAERIEIRSMFRGVVSISIAPGDRSLVASYQAYRSQRDRAEGFVGNKIDLIWVRNPRRELSATPILWYDVQRDPSGTSTQMRHRFGGELARETWARVSRKNGSPINILVSLGSSSLVCGVSDTGTRKQVELVIRAALTSKIAGPVQMLSFSEAASSGAQGFLAQVPVDEALLLSPKFGDISAKLLRRKEAVGG